ncbi:MAG: hypothetical protein KF794_14220 [Xanthobacteraceae bacterium]|nr:hypothetical protein [Xanthobacteraceae bacterium]QYK44890.1 MAG: hypothetical protein KF794_14220 [Xanthobacteraceae bacterium]HMN51243.1 hypothetical protein [Xanthobacteraceae bacterium]
MLRKFALAVAAAGALGLAATATPAAAGAFTGLKAPSVESNTIDARCYHRRHWSGWRCYRHHRRWRSRHHW